jgi:hypothetical protein
MESAKWRSYTGARLSFFLIGEAPSDDERRVVTAPSFALFIVARRLRSVNALRLIFQALRRNLSLFWREFAQGGAVWGLGENVTGPQPMEARA